MNEFVNVLDHGFVRLDQSMASDLNVVNSARISFGVRHEELDDSDKGLIKFLMKNRHGTPFESSVFTFHVKAPIFVLREWMRHRIGSFNERSARYSKVDSDFYVPLPQDLRTQVGKPGAYSFEPWKGNVQLAIGAMVRHNQDALDLYNWYLEAGMAKEQARLVLPVSLYSEMYWTVNTRSLMNFISLRNSPQAMFEIRSYAEVVEALWAVEMPVTHEAFVANNRITP